MADHRFRVGFALARHRDVAGAEHHPGLCERKLTVQIRQGVHLDGRAAPIALDPLAQECRKPGRLVGGGLEEFEVRGAYGCGHV